MRIDEIRELATKYSKPDLARMVQMGMIEPQKALMAGMMIDRIAKSAMSPPQSTVAQEVFGVQPGGTGTMAGTSLGAQGQELGPTAPMTMAPPAMAASGGIMSALPHSAGVAGLPSGLQNMAGGGIVAFAEGDLVSASDTMRRGLASQQAPMAAESGLPTLPGGLRFKEYDAMAAPTLESEFETSRRAEQMAGVDTAGLFSKLRQEEAGRREELKGRREEAKGEALLMAGLGLMGARRGQEFEVLSNVGRQAVMQYGSALKELRDTERDIKKSERELMLAEDKYKRDQSTANANRLAQKQEKYEDRKIRSVDQYNKAVEEVTRLNMEVFKLERKEASDMAIAQVQAKTSRDVAEIHERGAMARVGAPVAEERIINKMLADLKKTNPNATYLDAVQAYKSSGKSNMLELQEKYADDWLKMDYLEKKKFKEQGITDEASYIAYRTRLSQQMSKGQTGGASVQQGAAGSGFSEGQESKDTNGRPIVYRNGQWVYK
jgi:hypothetical protein